MADVHNLQVMTNPQLLKAQAKETTLLRPAAAQGVAQQCPSRGLQCLSLRKNSVVCLPGTGYPEHGQRKGLEISSLPLGGAEAFFVQTAPFVTWWRKTVNQAVYRSIGRAHYADDLILLEGEFSECTSWGVGFSDSTQLFGPQCQTQPGLVMNL